MSAALAREARGERWPRKNREENCFAVPSRKIGEDREGEVDDKSSITRRLRKKRQ